MNIVYRFESEFKARNLHDALEKFADFVYEKKLNELVADRNSCVFSKQLTSKSIIATDEKDDKYYKAVDELNNGMKLKIEIWLLSQINDEECEYKAEMIVY